MGEVQLDLRNTVYWMRLILPKQAGTEMSKETKKIMGQHHVPRLEFIGKVESTESQDRERNLEGGDPCKKRLKSFGFKTSPFKRSTMC